MTSQPWYDFNTTQAHGVNGERGIDIGTPINTPLTALYGGTVVGEGYHTYGGEVDILTYIPGLGPVIEYFIHLNDIGAGIVKGAAIRAGQVIGVSGGQTSGGDHPATTGSDGPHTEFGLVPDNAQHSAWVGTAYDPTFAINAARGGKLSSSSSSSTGGAPSAGDIAGALIAGPSTIAGIVGSAFGGVTDIPGAIKSATQSLMSGVVALAERIGLFLLALMALGFGILLIIWAPASDAVKKVAGVAAVAG